MRILAILMLVPLVLAAGTGGEAEDRMTAPIEGDAGAISVFDGDSFTLAGQHVRLAGIDAPELGQVCHHPGSREARCGLMAGYELRKRLQLEPGRLRCWPVGGEMHGAVVATCAAGEDDVALEQIEAGYAFVLANAQIDYRLAEEKARAAGLGVWAGSVTVPSDWRKERDQAPDPAPAEGCVIAGVVESGGARLYYGPLDPEYGSKSVRPEKGARWFCSEEQARAAGWRRPGEG